MSPKRLASSAAFIVAIALVLRLAVLWWTWHRAAPAPPDTPFAYELGCLAKSIASGKGFSSPLPFLDTGPTAWHAPIFPYLLGGIFRLWGVYSVKSHIISQTLNCLFSALTIFPIYGMARRSFGSPIGVCASWLWVVLPTAWHLPLAEDNSALAALCFALLVWTTLGLRGERSPVKWAGYGALWAVGALINTALVSVLPFFMIWLAWEARKERAPWLRPAAVAGLVFVLGLAPWTIRNYCVFGRFVPVRSVLGITLWMGNNPVAVGINSFPLLPVLNMPEAEKFKQMGEIEYAHADGREALDFMRSHPGQTLHHVLRDFGSFWFSVSDRADETWSTDPFYVRALLVLNGFMIVFVALGIGLAWRARNPYTIPYICVILAFPIVYYVTFSLVRFRFPMEPILTVLAMYGAVEVLQRSYPSPAHISGDSLGPAA